MLKITRSCSRPVETTVFMDWMLAFVESPAARMLVVVREKFAAHLHCMRADARVGRLSYENSSTSCAEGEHALLKKQNHGYSPLQDIDAFVCNTIENERLRAITKRTLTCTVHCGHPLLYTPLPIALDCTRHTPRESVP